MTSPYELRAYRPGDEHAILATFNRVFRPPGGAQAARSAEEWRWAFAQNPAGLRIWLALQGETVCAQSAGWPLVTRVDGREGCFTLSVDSMVHPEHASGLRNPGLFVRTVNAYDDDYGGRLDQVHFGWPNRASLRIGRAFLHYEVVREQTLLGRAPRAGTTALPAGVTCDAGFDAGFDAGVRGLWERAARDWGASTVRDARYLEWRFAAHPGRPYEVLTARTPGGELCGQAVCRMSDWPRAGLYWIADWLVPEAEPEAGELLLAAVAARARARGAEALAAFFPEWSAWSARFRRAGFIEQKGDLFLTVRSYDPTLDAAWLRERWWVQPSESDLL